MAAKFHMRQFFRVTSNAALSDYFARVETFPFVEFRSLGESDVGPIVEAVDSLRPEIRAQVESDFELIHRLADEPGIQAVLEEARYDGTALAPLWADIDGFHERLLQAFFTEPRWLHVAARLREADSLPRSRWTRRTGINMERIRDDRAAQQELADALSAYLRERQGRGYHCAVEALRRGDAIYFFAYPEDYARVEAEWVEGHLERRPHRFAFQVVFVVRPAAGSLDTWASTPRAVAYDLEQIFSRVVAGTELSTLPDGRPVYELNALKDRRFEWVIDPSTDLQDVRVQSVRLAVLGRRNGRITVEADVTDDAYAAYDMLDLTLGRESAPIPPALLNVTRVKLQARFAADGRPGRNTRTFELTHPNGCGLDHEGRDGTIRACLLASGIELLPANVDAVA